MTKPEALVRGDIVRCIRADETFGLEVGLKYTIEAHHSWIGGVQLVYLEGRPDVVPLRADRFELVQAGTKRMAQRDLAIMETLEIAGIEPTPPPQRSEDPEAAADRRMTRADMVNLPQHYARYAIEPIRFICENALDFMRGNAVKYILRCDAKNGEEDLDKAIRYLEMFRAFRFRQDPDWWRPKIDSTAVRAVA